MGRSQPSPGEEGRREDVTLVDCDIHIDHLSEELLAERMPPRYRDRGVTLPSPGYAHPHGRKIEDAGQGWSERASPEKTREFLLDRFDVDYGIITGSTPVLGVSAHPNADYATELARVHNQYVVESWLSEDDRLRGSVVVAPQDASGAVELIEEFGSHPRMVQVVMGSSADDVYGSRKYWPVYEAAVDNDLPVAIHPANDGAGTSNPLGPGHPETYFEFHNVFPNAYVAHVNSLVVRGVFEKFPDLQFVGIEGGFAWLPHLVWRMDKNWRSLRDQAPWLEHPPSHYVRRNLRLTTQPVPEPERAEHLTQLLEMIHADETLMFCSDFPHWDGDDPMVGLPTGLSNRLRDRITHGTAMDVYDLCRRDGTGWRGTHEPRRDGVSGPCTAMF